MRAKLDGGKKRKEKTSIITINGLPHLSTISSFCAAAAAPPPPRRPFPPWLLLVYYILFVRILLSHTSVTTLQDYGLRFSLANDSHALKVTVS